MQAAPAVARILETSLYVTDLERARAFYQRLFAFDVLFADARMCALGVAGGGVLLLFRGDAAPAPSTAPGGVIPPHHGSGELHLCFAIARADLACWERHLALAGVAIESRVAWPRGGESLYFRDPDGHSLEVATPGLWPGR